MINEVICEHYKVGLGVIDRARLDTELLIPNFNPNYDPASTRTHQSNQTHNLAQNPTPKNHPILSAIVTNKDTYLVGRPIGNGAQARVYEARGSDGSQYAAKIYNTNESTSDELRRISRESEILRSLDHPNIIELLDFAENGLYTAMIFALKSENLAKYTMRNCDERGSKGHTITMVKFLAQVADALAHTHSKRIIHRDVKPENILIANNRAYLTDFGVATTLDEYLKERDIAGTPLYMSPEELRFGNAGPYSDMWSLGVTLYHMLAEEMPFDGKNILDISSQIQEQEPMDVREKRKQTIRSEPEDLPEGIEELTHDLLQKDPTKRPTARQFISTAEEILKYYSGSFVLNS